MRGLCKALSFPFISCAQRGKRLLRLTYPFRIPIPYLRPTDHLLPRSFPILFLRNLLFLLPSPPLRSARDKEGEGNKRKKGEGMGNDVQMVWGPRFLYLLNPTFSFSLFVYSFLILFLCFPFISRAQGAKKARNVRKAIELRRNRNVKGKVFGDSRA